LTKGCRYDEVRSLYVKQLAYVLVEDWTGEMRMRVEKKFDIFAEGNLQYATGTVSALWELVKHDMDINAPSITSAVSVFRVSILCSSAYST
jgi:hypothetical protein